MSNVTNLIISFSIVEDEKNRMREVNAFQNNGHGFKINSADFQPEANWIGQKSKKRWYGGSNMLETPLYVGAYEDLDIEGLVHHMKMIEWEELENVQLIMKEQDSDKFKIVDLT